MHKLKLKNFTYNLFANFQFVSLSHYINLIQLVHVSYFVSYTTGIDSHFSVERIKMLFMLCQTFKISDFWIFRAESLFLFFILSYTDHKFSTFCVVSYKIFYPVINFALGHSVTVGYRKLTKRNAILVENRNTGSQLISLLKSQLFTVSKQILPPRSNYATV